MTDKKLTDTEIEKALEWCERFTDNLVMANIDTKKRTLGLQAMQTCKKALDLINRLQAEVENYKQIAENQQKIILDKAFENKRLRENNKTIMQTIADVHAVAIKEFAERLKEKGFIILHHKTILSSDIDNLLKELVGEDNG